MEPTYVVFELPDSLTEEQFKERISYFQSQGYVIPGVITDYNNKTIIVIGRKPTAEELAQRNTEDER